MSQDPRQSEERTFDLSVRRQYRFGNFKLALDPVGFGYQPRALLRLDKTQMTLTKVSVRGKPPMGRASAFPASWSWRVSQVLNAQAFVVTSSGWGPGHPPAGLRLDIHGEAFYPLLATYAMDDLMNALQGRGVTVDRNPRKLSLFLTGWR